MARTKKNEEVTNVQAPEAVQGGDEGTGSSNAVLADLSTIYTPNARKPRIQSYPDGTQAIHW